jgi:hypothetical protein
VDLQPSELRGPATRAEAVSRRQTVVGGTPAQLLQIIQDNAGEQPQSSSACLLAACKTGLCAMAVCKQPSLVPTCAGERPSDGKGGGGLRGALRGLALGAAAAAAVLLAARAVLRARTVQDEAPGERMQRELRDLQRRIEVLPTSCPAPLEGQILACMCWKKRGCPGLICYLHRACLESRVIADLWCGECGEQTLRKAARKSRRLGPKEAAERKERLRELKSREAVRARVPRRGHCSCTYEASCIATAPRPAVKRHLVRT